MTCSGFVTNETCWFTCEDGYEIQGSGKKTCLSSSKWDGQQTSCKGNNNGSWIASRFSHFSVFLLLFLVTFLSTISFLHQICLLLLKIFLSIISCLTIMFSNILIFLFVRSLYCKLSMPSLVSLGRYHLPCQSILKYSRYCSLHKST